MNEYEINTVTDDDIECEDGQTGHNNIKVANQLVKNYLLLKELNLLSVIKEEEPKIDYTSKKPFQYDSSGLISANQYMLDFIQKKKANKLKEKEELKWKKIKYEQILNDKEIDVINNILHSNELNLCTYKNNITNYDELKNFQNMYSSLHMNRIETSSISKKKYHSNVSELLNNLIKSYNSLLEIIKIQQNVINDFSFYTRNLLISNKALIQKNENLCKNYAGDMKIKKKWKLNSVNDTSSNREPNTLSVSLEAQIDLYRRHINYLYSQNDELKKLAHLLN